MPWYYKRVIMYPLIIGGVFLLGFVLMSIAAQLPEPPQ